MTKAYPRIYQFGPVFKTLLLVASAGLIGLGIWGTASAYASGGDLEHRFTEMLLSLVPMAIALFGAPALWQCRLELYEDHLEYYGLLVRRVIRKADIQEALSEPRYGMVSVILTLYGQPLKSVRIALLGKMDDGLARWVEGVSVHRA